MSSRRLDARQRQPPLPLHGKAGKEWLFTFHTTGYNQVIFLLAHALQTDMQSATLHR
jgi:hypothetical protein